MTEQTRIIFLKVTPRAKQPGIKIEPGEDGEPIYRVSVRAVAEGGKANAAVIALLAEHFHCPKSAISIKSGAKSRLKRVEISGQTER